MSFDNRLPFEEDNTTNSFNAFGDDDPAAEFLAREKRELGDITGDDDSTLFSDQFSSQSTLTGVPTSSNPNLVANGTHSLFMNTGGSNSPTPSSGQNTSNYQALSQFSEQLNEPEKIKRWREEFTARIAKKDADEEVKRQEMHEQARKELEDFYRQRTEQLERTRGQNRVNNRTLEDDLFHSADISTVRNEGKNDWDKITSLCDFNPKHSRSQKDLTRYRSILLQLKQQASVK